MFKHTKCESAHVQTHMFIHTNMLTYANRLTSHVHKHVDIHICYLEWVLTYTTPTNKLTHTHTNTLYIPSSRVQSICSLRVILLQEASSSGANSMLNGGKRMTHFCPAAPLEGRLVAAVLCARIPACCRGWFGLTHFGGWTCGTERVSPVPGGMLHHHYQTGIPASQPPLGMTSS